MLRLFFPCLCLIASASVDGSEREKEDLPLHMRFKIFHVVNPTEVVTGASKAKFEERGPYTYRVSRDKRNVNNGGSYVDFELYREFEYVKELSCEGCEKTDSVRILNMPLIGAVAGALATLFNMLKLVASLALLAVASAQVDTHFCPDGWIVSDVGEEIECVLLGGLYEHVSKPDAEILCAAHGGWLVDMDEGHGGQKNRFIKELISEAVGQNGIGRPGNNYDDQWWIGATVDGPHGDHNWGHWTWDHNGNDVTWYDWMDGEPNDWQHEQGCLTFLKDQDLFGYGTYHWNDWGCDWTARYICESAPIPTNATLLRLY